MSLPAPLWGLTVSAAVAVAGWRGRPAPRRARHLVTGGHAGSRRGPEHRALDRALVLAGRAALRLTGRTAPATADARRLGTALAVAVPVALAVPAAAPAVGLAVWLVPAHRRRRRRARHHAAVRAAVPEVVDLFSLAVGAGLTVPLALHAVAGRTAGPVGDGLREATRQAAVGARVADALEGMPATVGEPVRPLVAALVASERYGVPLAGSLERLAADVRADRRRSAEEAARRVPVKLLFPLVVCILPAFALLTVVPLAASALGSLRL